MKKFFGICMTLASFNLSAVGYYAADQSKPETNVVQELPKAKSAEDMQWAAWMIEASQASEEFVSLIDKGRYSDSWNKGSQIFQKTIPQNEWEFALDQARKPLGQVVSRSLKDQRPAMDPRGLPAGPYMVVEYNTSFQKAPQSGELITLRREDNGKWKVLTYQVN